MPRSVPASTAPSLPLIALGKALASQLIVWHHLTLYSPMRELLDPLAPALFAWLAGPARMVVQLFLVMAGFLAARSLLPSPGAPATLSLRDWPARLAQRYRRLVPPCLAALALALCSAALARALMDDERIPAAPTWTQLLANVLLLQDIVGEQALSAGLWYVAIDLQLFAMLLLLCGLRPWLPAALRAPLTLLAIAGLCAASWWQFNREAGWDAWGLYFFGAYGVGLMAAWLRRMGPGWGWRLGWLALALLVASSLWLEWRERVLLAGLAALALALPMEAAGPLAPLHRGLCRLARQPAIAWLSRMSYSVFLAHYPVCLLVGALVAACWPDALLLNALGLVAAWALSLGAGWLLHEAVEKPAMRRPPQPLSAAGGWMTLRSPQGNPR